MLDLRESMCMGYFFYGELAHERAAKEIINRALPADGTFVDIGANIGYYTRMAARIVGPTGQVLAFEPLPKAFRLLERNTSALLNVSLFQVALGNQSATVSFYVHPSGDQSSTIRMKRALESLRVEMIKLDSLIEHFKRLDFIKIDVEGTELDILHGARKTIERFQPVVQFEFLQRYAEQNGTRLADFEEFFYAIPKADYSIWRVSENAQSGLLSPKEGRGNDMLAIPRGKNYLFFGGRMVE